MKQAADSLSLGLMDFASYLVPGVLFTWVLASVFERVTGVPFPVTAVESAGASVMFLIVAYIVGHGVQALASCRAVSRAPGPRPSEKYWDDKDKHFPAAMKARLKQAALSYFGLPDDTPPNTVFDLIYALAVQRHLSDHIASFLALYELYRGLALSAALGAGVLLVVLLTGGSIAVIPVDLNHAQWPAGLVVILMLAGASWLFVKRCRRFDGSFADAVYRAFYVFYVGLAHSDADRC